jgi:hypothetical protein
MLPPRAGVLLAACVAASAFAQPCPAPADARVEVPPAVAGKVTPPEKTP